MVKLFKQRKQSPALRNGGMELADTGNPHLFAYIREGGDQRLLIINNFSEYAQVMHAAKLAASGMTHDAPEIFTQRTLPAGEDLEIDAYRYLWIDISGQ
jgi:amylosucrase